MACSTPTPPVVGIAAVAVPVIVTAAAAGVGAAVAATSTAAVVPTVAFVAVACSTAAVGRPRSAAVGSTVEPPTAVGKERLRPRSSSVRLEWPRRSTAAVVWLRFVCHRWPVSCGPRRTFGTSTAPSVATIPFLEIIHIRFCVQPRSY